MSDPDLTEICSKCWSRPRKPGQRWCRLCHAAYMREWRKTHPLEGEARKRQLARNYAKTYVRRGQLEKLPCVKCGSADSQMHHESYDNPLDIEWVCRPCHLALHKGRWRFAD